MSTRKPVRKKKSVRGKNSAVDPADDSRVFGRLQELLPEIRTAISRRIVGQSEIVEALLAAILGGGHVLLIGLPGLGKTLLVKTVAEILGLEFKRIQFTPDLMPADITGSEVLEESSSGKKKFRFIDGPVFANLILADEVNRTPPRTQSALLQAMEERQVSVGGQTLDLPQPHLVLATQNPLEQEGTYPLPEAQLDRFLFSVFLDYPAEEEEVAIAQITRSAKAKDLPRLTEAADWLAFQALTERVPVAPSMAAYAVEKVRATRPENNDTLKDYVQVGAGPRASQSLLTGARARALLNGDMAVDQTHIDSMVPLVLPHRLILTYQAVAEGWTSQKIINELL